MVNLNAGKRLTQLRNYLDLNQEEFASKIKLTKASVSNYETGKRNISDRVIADICRAFHTSEQWLKYGEGEMFNHSSKSLIQQKVLDEIEAMDDRELTAVLAFINSLDSVKNIVK